MKHHFIGLISAGNKMQDYIYVGIALGIALSLSVLVILALILLLFRVCRSEQRELSVVHRQRQDERSCLVECGNKVWSNSVTQLMRHIILQEGPIELQTFKDRSTSCSLSFPDEQLQSGSMSPSISSVEVCYSTTTPRHIISHRAASR